MLQFLIVVFLALHKKIHVHIVHSKGLGWVKLPTNHNNLIYPIEFRRLRWVRL
jgi:hypothetical protein